jgi:AcrR family transcriptional regulator
LQFVESVQQQTIQALFDLFQAPLQVLNRLQPETLVQQMRQQLDSVIASLTGLNLPTLYNQLKGKYFDLKVAVDTQGVQAKIELTAFLDPDRQLGEVMQVYNSLLAALQTIRDRLQLPNLGALYTQLKDRLLGMLPPYAREVMNPETFKRVMRLADPTRFLQALDQRFQTLKDKLLPIRPQDITAELDAAYNAVLGLVDGLQIETGLNQIKTLVNNTKGIVNSIRVDFLAGDIDRALAEFRALVTALNPSRVFSDLDSIHHEVELVVQSTVPSQLLAGLQTTLNQVQAIVARINPRNTLGPPLDQAWQAVEGVLEAIDFTVILSPLVDKLTELETSFIASLRLTETAFDDVLRAAQEALRGGGSGSGGSIGGSI